MIDSKTIDVPKECSQKILNNRLDVLDDFNRKSLIQVLTAYENPTKSKEIG